jgi:hypothetical protein
MPLRRLLILALLNLICPTAWAQAHVHGEAELDVALEGTRVDLAFIAPGASLIGFENKPHTAQQQTALDNLRRAFSQPLHLFAFNGVAGCTIAQAELTEPESLRSAHAQEEPVSHEHAAEDATLDAHDHDHDHDHEDWHFALTLDCAEPKHITELDVSGLFRAFAALDRLNVQVIGPGMQSGARVTRDESRIELVARAPP